MNYALQYPLYIWMYFYLSRLNLKKELTGLNGLKKACQGCRDIYYAKYYGGGGIKNEDLGEIKTGEKGK